MTNRATRSSSVDSNLTHFNSARISTDPPVLTFHNGSTMALVNGVKEYINAKLQHLTAAATIRRFASAAAGGTILVRPHPT